jgi:hypothetical protein
LSQHEHTSFAPQMPWPEHELGQDAAAAATRVAITNVLNCGGGGARERAGVAHKAHPSVVRQPHHFSKRELLCGAVGGALKSNALLSIA